LGKTKPFVIGCDRGRKRKAEEKDASHSEWAKKGGGGDERGKNENEREQSWF